LNPHSLARATGLLLVAVLTGCAHEHIRAYPPMSEAQALETLREHSHAIKTVSSAGTLTLTRPNGDGVRLDAALALQLPDRARLRAWKFGHAVFDMTLTPDGLWLAAEQNDERKKDVLAAGSNAAALTRQWLQLITGSFDGPGIMLTGDGKMLQFTRRNDDGTILLCEIQRKTLTPRTYFLKNAEAQERFSLRLGDYAEINGITWPHRIEAVSETGRISIDLRDVSINTELAPNAFRPPARAEKVP
jgi:hypothetical protein